MGEKYIFSEDVLKRDITKKITTHFNTVIHSPKLWLTLIIPPIAVIIIGLAVFAGNGLYPFGDKTLAWCDMHQQVLPLLLDFKDILEGKGDFLFNWQNAGGMNFLGVFLFFISSPFSLLVVFVDKADMMLFMNIMTLMKMAVCAITANAYFRTCHKKLDVVYSALFSVMYAFSGYSMLFYQNTVWLDVMYFFPLLLIAFNSLIKSKRIGGFIFCLVGMLVLNYYLSYMVVLFTILFFGVYLFFNRKKGSTKGIAPRFILGCAIAALISAVVWLPSFVQYLSSARGANILEGLFESTLFAGIYTNLPLIFCTGFSVAAFIVYFLRRKSKSSRFYAVMAFLTLLPVIFEPINKMWHTGDYMAFPMRYGYMTTLMMLTFAAVKLSHTRSEDYAEKSKKGYFAGILAASVIFFGFTVWYYYRFKNGLDSYVSTLWGSAESFCLLIIIFCGFTALYVITMSFGVFRKLTFRTVGTVLAVIVAAECVFNANVYIGAAAYTPVKYNNAMALEGKIPQDDDFYRVKLSQWPKKYFDANLIGGLGYPTVAHYTSLTSEHYMYAMKRLGYSSYWMEVTGNGGTALTDAVMNIKYYIEKFSAREPVIYRDRNYSIYESEFYLPLGIVTDSDLSKCEELPAAERMIIQEYFAGNLLNTGNDLLFTKYEHTGEKNVRYTYRDGMYYFTPKSDVRTATLSYKLKIDDKQSLYFDCFDLVTRNIKEHINGSFAIYVNGIKTDLSFPGQDSNGLLYLGTFENESVSIDVDVNTNTYCSSFGVIGLSHDKLENAISRTKTADLTVDGGSISGTVEDAGDGQWLFLSVPYDSGFSAKINGHKAEIYRCMTGFMALKLDEGHNDIAVSFLPKGLKEGGVLTVGGLVALALYIIFRRKLEAVYAKVDGICRIGVYALLCGVLSVVYILPLIISIIGNIYATVNQ